MFALQQLVSAGNAKDRTAERRRPVVIPDAVHAIGVRFVMNLFIQILATVEMNGQVDVFSHPPSISSRRGRCLQDKGFGHQSSVAIQLSAAVIAVVRGGGCIA